VRPSKEVLSQMDELMIGENMEVWEVWEVFGLA
jgi:hypothetical protein